ncbi:FadR/GntR family transcriptional regulator [Fodinicurvata fenggangensis]|uniref:FadR/GntR family transcriptional regulator n=1 Tax=Fodinicurvata fenggangensis TaxID=1121830 RepID=UPI0009E07551|nr:FadR/GntR family transcriptional regulator [Fodinicurvata fenggangensis]
MFSSRISPLSDRDDRFQEIRRERVSERVAQELTRLIANGKLAPGERLPGERQLADMLGVSRVSVRAALQELKARGFLSAVQGGGTRVVGMAEELDSGLISLLRADQRNLNDLAEMRANLEVWAARRAARNASENQVCEIEEAYRSMADASRAPRHKAEDDLRFHLAIAQASGSAVYLHLMSVLGNTLEKMFSFHRYALYATPEDDARFLDHHRRIAEAIRARDEDAAAGAMAEHLDSILRRYRQASDEDEAQDQKALGQ